MDIECFLTRKTAKQCENFIKTITLNIETTVLLVGK